MGLGRILGVGGLAATAGCGGAFEEWHAEEPPAHVEHVHDRRTGWETGCEAAEQDARRALRAPCSDLAYDVDRALFECGSSVHARVHAALQLSAGECGVRAACRAALANAHEFGRLSEGTVCAVRRACAGVRLRLPRDTRIANDFEEITGVSLRADTEKP